ncbi:MAG TPA: class I SAM-dependent methyltransferase [Bacteroidales bacterium]|nr:class I SAM-dependent methyltransferase [Bacteroidales bacterium]
MSASEREFNICTNCELIFADKEYHLPPDEEKKRYTFHNNNIENKGYVDFLNQIILPARQLMPSRSQCLDYGCGPNPVLAKILHSYGTICDYYDPYFFPELNTDKKYDIVFASECFEHFFNPAKEIENIIRVLSPNGILAIMTEFWKDEKPFSEWYYIKDPTHVCFYHLKTFDHICKNFGLVQKYTDNFRVVLLSKC